MTHASLQECDGILENNHIGETAMRLQKIIKHFPTYIKYFLSYFIILSVMIMSFFFILKYDLSKRYLNQLSEQSFSQMHTLMSDLNDDLLFLDYITTSLQSNITLINSRYNNNGFQNYQARKELVKYATINPMIKSICYINKNTGDIVTTDHIIYYENNIVRIKASSSQNLFLEFNPELYFDSSSGNMFFLKNTKMEQLIYFPTQSGNLDYFIFFIIDTNTIKEYIEKIISATITSVILIDDNKQIIAGVHTDYLLPYFDTIPSENRIMELDSTSSICMYTKILGDFSAVSLVSNDSLNQQLDKTFSSSYFMILLLSCVGFILILLCMNITYRPLRSLVQKLVPEYSFNQEYLLQLDNAFTNTLQRKDQLEQKLRNYQISFKKSLFNSAIEARYSDMYMELPDIDLLFDFSIPKELFVIRIQSPAEDFPYLLIQNYLQDALSSRDSCILLELESDSILLLINFLEPHNEKKNFLLELLQNIYRKYGFFSCISDGSNSPLDIPLMCQNTQRASSLWTQIPIIDCQYVAPAQNFSALNYPHNQLEKLEEALRNIDIEGTQNVLQDIFKIIHHSIQEEHSLPDFYVRCILIDLITLIISYINQAGIPSDSYNELYYETLFFCRSFPYEEKGNAIEANIHQLLNIYQQQAGNYITSAQIKKIIETSYCDPAFSIYELADKLQISFTYASNLIKKKLHQNFSDYVWALRFEKAKELLKNTDMSIDDISIAVGYQNVSSFRRKFKLETGITPSQYRASEASQQP